MIFENEQPIDDNVIELVKRIKALIKKNPKIQWNKSKNCIVTIENFLSFSVSILYERESKDKFLIYTNSEEGSSLFASAENPRVAVNYVTLFNFIEQGVSKELIAHIAHKLSMKETIKSAVESIVKTDLLITHEEMRILGMDYKYRGFVDAQRYGV